MYSVMVTVENLKEITVDVMHGADATSEKVRKHAAGERESLAL